MNKNPVKIREILALQKQVGILQELIKLNAIASIDALTAKTEKKAMVNKALFPNLILNETSKFWNELEKIAPEESFVRIPSDGFAEEKTYWIYGTGIKKWVHTKEFTNKIKELLPFIDWSMVDIAAVQLGVICATQIGHILNESKILKA